MLERVREREHTDCHRGRNDSGNLYRRRPFIDARMRSWQGKSAIYNVLHMNDMQRRALFVAVRVASKMSSARLLAVVAVAALRNHAYLIRADKQKKMTMEATRDTNQYCACIRPIYMLCFSVNGMCAIKFKHGFCEIRCE